MPSTRYPRRRPARTRARYLRFVLPTRDDDSRTYRGIFLAAYELRRSGNLTREASERLDRSILWFELNLAVPDCLSDVDSGRAVCWFRPQAVEMLREVWSLVYLLREHGLAVRMLKSPSPGKIIYEDDHQVAAFPSRSDRLRG